MKINILLPEYGLSGGVMVILRYAEYLCQRGEDVVCYAPKVSYKLSNRFVFREFLHKIHRLLSNYDRYKAEEIYNDVVMKVPLFISDKSIRNADAIIATAWCTAYDVARLSQEKGKKIYFIQGYEVWDDEELGKKSYELPLKHIVISKGIDDILVNKLHCDPGIIVRNGIDTNSFYPDMSKRDGNSIKCLMMFHRLEKKGVEDGLAAFISLSEKYSNLELTMFGKFAYDDRPPFVKYYKDPPHSLLLNLYQMSDIFIFPSREEGWGLTPIEAMACECAVVGTNAGCMTEIGENDVNALLSNPYDVDALTANLERLIVDKNKRKDIAHKGYLSIQTLSWDQSCETFSDILYKIVNE